MMRFQTSMAFMFAGMVVCCSLIANGVSAKEITRKFAYDPVSGSHFEYVRRPYGSIGGNTWKATRKRVSHRSYKGIPGRLAVVKTKRIHEFLNKNFKITEAWIGLRYYCSSKKLFWVTGEVLKRGTDFEIWHRQWYRNPEVRCSTKGIPYMPVYYKRQGLRVLWQASGPNKGLHGYIIEYPSNRRRD